MWIAVRPAAVITAVSWCWPSSRQTLLRSRVSTSSAKLRDISDRTARVMLARSAFTLEEGGSRPPLARLAAVASRT
jgi:hypothetical protein